MTTRRIFLCLLLLATAAANTDAADITGRWMATISVDGQTIRGVALLTQTGDKIVGSIGADESNQHPLDGIADGNRITLTTHPRPGRTVAFARCELILDREKMTGTTEGGDLGRSATIELSRMRE